MKRKMLLVILSGAFFCSCNPTFLDVKPSKQTMVPVTLKDFQGLADDVNMFGYNSLHTLGIVSGEDILCRACIFSERLV